MGTRDNNHFKSEMCFAMISPKGKTGGDGGGFLRVLTHFRGANWRSKGVRFDVFSMGEINVLPR